MTAKDIPYLIVATDYATTCSGTCPTCVLTKDERLLTFPATNAAKLSVGFREAAASYGRADTLALGIGRANVLDLPSRSICEIGDIVKAAAEAFDHREMVVEISTSLVGKIDRQIARAKEILAAAEEWPCDDVRFVIVANTALHSEKYWKNVDTFYQEMADLRGGANVDHSGDIVQLALASDSMPDPSVLAARIGGYRSPVNLTWAPAFDRGLDAGESALETMGQWIESWYALTSDGLVDSSLVNRVRQSMGMMDSGMREAAQHADESGRAVVYVAPDGTWHNGLFTVLAEMDPVRFDPLAGGKAMSGTDPRELRRFLTNPACAACEFSNACIASGSHRIGMIALRQFPGGTSVCPSGLQSAFASASRETLSAGRPGHGNA